MKIYWVLILTIFLSRENLVADNLYLQTICTVGSRTVQINEKEILQNERRRVETARRNFKFYECPLFKIGDLVTYSFYYIYFEKTDFVGIVTKIEPKPTTEYIYWITVQKLSGSGTSGVYCERFLERYGK